MKRFIYALVTLAVVLMLISSGMAQNEDIQFNLDVARFKLDSDNVFLEVYYSIGQTGLTFVPDENGGYVAQVLVKLRIHNEDGVAVDQAWKVPSHVADTTEVEKANNIVDLIRFALKPGQYYLEASVQDLGNVAQRDSIRKEVKLMNLADSEVSLSDIQMASSIKRIPKDPNNVFYKNTLQVIPNPNCLYGEGLSKLYYYVEAYNLDSDEVADKYNTKCYVSIAKGDTAHTLNERKQSKRIAGASSVEIGALDVSELQSGSYFLNFDIMDQTGQVLDSQVKKFYVYNPGVLIEEGVVARSDSLLELSVFADMPEEQLDKEASYIQYVIAKQGAEYYKELTSTDAKRRFLFGFWQRRDPSPGTVFNEYRENYLRKVKEANERFKAIGREGWHTDRGRVFITYGPPSNIEWFRNNPDTRPYEIWHYNNISGEGDAQFVFADVTGFEDYRLLHSTLRGEVQNENWPNLIVEHPN